MIDVSSTIYRGDLPLPLVREVRILPSSPAPRTSGFFRFETTLSLQLPKGSPVSGEWVVSLMTIKNNIGILDVIRSDPALLRTFIAQPTIARHNKVFPSLTPISNYPTTSRDQDLVLYNKKGGNLAVSRELKIFSEIEILENEVLEDLSIIAVVYQSNDEIALSGTTAYIGTPIVETILVNSTVPLQTNIFIDPSTNELWTGPVHFHSQLGFMAGASHTATPHPQLTRVRVPNQKIKDSRVEKYMMDLISNVDYYRSNLQKTIEEARSNDINYFGEAEYSRGFDNSVKVYLPFDYLRFVRNNISLSGLFQNRTSFLACTTINSIDVYRRRISTKRFGNKLTPGDGMVINDCGEGNPQLITSYPGGNLNLLKIPSIAGIFHLIVDDNSMTNVVEGQFEYYCELVIEDHTHVALKNIIDSLERRLQDYELYVAELSNYYQSGYFNNENFLRANINRFTTNTAWSSLVTEFMGAISFLFGPQAFTQMSSTKWQATLMSYANPYSATSWSLLRLKEIVHIFMKSLGSLADKAMSANSEEKFNIKSRIASSNARFRSIEAVHSIRPTYNNEFAPVVGFDYFGGGIVKKRPVAPRIATQDYVTRIQKEVEKYGTGVSNTSIPIDNKYGFLSPRVIRTPTINILVDRSIPIEQAYDLYQANVLPQTKAKDFRGDPTTEKHRYAEMNRILAFEGVSFRALEVPLSDLAANCGEIAIETEDSSLYMSDTDEFVLDDSYIVEAIEGNNTPAYKKNLKQLKDLMKNAIINLIVEESISSYKDIKIDDLRAIRGSLAYRRMQQSPSPLRTDNILELNCNFNSIMRVEYLAGYSRALSRPRWRRVTEEILSTSINDNVPLFCRLKETNTVFNVENKFNLGAYFQFFVLGNRDFATFNRIRPDFKKVYINSVKASTVKNELPVINIRNMEASCFPVYTVSNQMIFTPTGPSTWPRPPTTPHIDASNPARAALRANGGTTTGTGGGGGTGGY